MLAIARLDSITSLSDFLNALQMQTTMSLHDCHKNYETQYLRDMYIGRIENKGKVCTLIMITMKAMYRTTLINPNRQKHGVTAILKHDAYIYNMPRKKSRYSM